MAIDSYFNFNLFPESALSFPVNTPFFKAFNVYESVPLGTANLMIRHGSGTQSYTLGLGFYQLLSSSVLSLINSGSVSTIRTTISSFYLQVTSFSSVQTLTPGTWYMVLSRSSNGGNSSNLSIGGMGNNNIATHALTRFYLGGLASATTSAFPVTINTSDANVGGAIARLTPFILITS